MIMLSTKYENGNLESEKVATRIRCPPHPYTGKHCVLYVCTILDSVKASSQLISFKPSSKTTGNLPVVKTKKPLQRVDESERSGSWLIEQIRLEEDCTFYLELKIRHFSPKTIVFSFKNNWLVVSQLIYYHAHMVEKYFPGPKMNLLRFGLIHPVLILQMHPHTPKVPLLAFSCSLTWKEPLLYFVPFDPGTLGQPLSKQSISNWLSAAPFITESQLS